MARDLRLNITGDSRSGQRALDDVADESDKAAATLRSLGREMRNAAREGGHLQSELEDVGGTARAVDGNLAALGREADKAAAEMRAAAAATGKLDAQLSSARTEITKLQQQIADGGDDTVVKDLAKQYAAYDRIAKIRARVGQEEETARKRAGELSDAYQREVHAAQQLEAQLAQSAKDLADVGGRAVKAGDSIYVLGDNAAKAAKKVDFATRATQRLDEELAATRAELDRLQRDFTETGDLKTLSVLEKQRGEYEKIAKTKKRIIEQDQAERKRVKADIERAAYLAKRAKRGVFGNTFADLFGIGKGIFGKTTKGATQAATDLNEVTSGVPGGTLAKVGLGAALAPPVGGAAAGAVLAGAGLLGVGAGVAGAIALDPAEFQKQWDDAIQHISVRWQLASIDFRKPALESFAIIRKAVDDIDIEGPLKAAAEYVLPLGRGFAGFLTEFGNGLGDLIKDAKPVIVVLAKDLPMLGKAFKEAFDQVGGSADSASIALHDVLSLTGTIVIAAGKFVAELAEIYAYARKIQSEHKLLLYGPAAGLVNDAKPAFMSYGRTLDGAKVSTDGFTKSQESLSAALKKVSDNLSAQLDNLLALDRANDAAATGIDKVKESFKQNGYAIDGNSKAAQANRDVLQGVIGDYLAQRDAAVAAGDGTGVSIGKANAVLRQHLEDLRAILIAHGDDTTAVDKYLQKLDSLDGKVVTVKVDVKYQEYNPGIALGNLLHHARGGTQPWDGAAMVGEHGPEIAWLNRQQYVSTAEETRKLMSMAGSASPTGAAASARLVVDAGAPAEVARLVQYLIDRNMIQAFAGPYQVGTRRG